MTALLLTPAEVAELSGYTRPSRQIVWLTRQGIRHYVGADGRPRVLREALIAGPSAQAKPGPRLRL